MAGASGPAARASARGRHEQRTAARTTGRSDESVGGATTGADQRQTTVRIAKVSEARVERRTHERAERVGAAEGNHEARFVLAQAFARGCGTRGAGFLCVLSRFSDTRQSKKAADLALLNDDLETRLRDVRSELTEARSTGEWNRKKTRFPNSTLNGCVEQRKRKAKPRPN